MIAVVGLGNVGKKYKNTRHNVGFMAIDKLAPAVKNTKNIVLLKPNTMMNSSGLAIKKLIENWKLKIEDLYIIHDDLDLKLGDYKIQFGKGPKAHKGVNSVEEELGTSGFWRVRIGVDNRDPLSRTPGEEYVLQDFSEAEKEIVNKVINKLCKELARL